ncbi:MAG: sigma-54 interaction domain-containing protein [Bacillota bacterium]
MTWRTKEGKAVGQVMDMLQRGQGILDALYDGVVVVDDKGMIIYVNEAHARITGISREEAVGRHVTAVVPDTSLPAVITTGQPMVGVRTRVGGQEVISNIVPLRDGDSVVGGVSVFRDLSEVSALARELEKARTQLRHLKSELLLSRGEDRGLVIGRNPVMQDVFRVAHKAAQVGSSVLLLGESGTGKEVLARFIHAEGPRHDKPFMTVNCAAIPETLLESELFGYEEGAFTGARRGGKLGLFELAEGGTLFLDEIGDMSLPLQSKLLRALQGKEIKRLGGTASRLVDVRIIAATNQDLEALIEQGRFRRDLFYRLNVIPLRLPPLRQRREDLTLLVATVLAKVRVSTGKPLDGVSAEAMKALMAYDYPGNIRELENILEQAAVMTEGRVIGRDDLPERLRGRTPRSMPAAPARMADRERQALLEALQAYPSKAEAARALGISRATLYRKLSHYGLEPQAGERRRQR